MKKLKIIKKKYYLIKYKNFKEKIHSFLKEIFNKYVNHLKNNIKIK
jgi:hypothetical protein